MTRDDKRCVITGLGMICAIGNSVEECWAAALAGKSGIDHTKTVDTENCYADMAGEVKCADLDKKGVTEHMDRASKLCISATDEAMKDAGLTGFDGDKRSGVIMGSCVGGVVSMEAYYKHGKKTRDVIAQMPISAIASQVAGVVGAGGPVTNIGNACAAGTISISHAADLIRAGKADIIIAGGSDAFASVPFAGFTSLHALSDKNCSPFNHSSGLNLGEGAGALVVESLAHAKARGAHIYCEVLGAGVSSDANHITAPREDGECQMFAIDRAIQNSGVGYGDIGYINAHGTGTAKNDAAEFLSLHALFDGKNDDLSVSSTKSMTGHCLGAAGAVEAVLSVKALTEDIVPPTVGYDKDDLEALKEKAGKLDMIPNKPRKKKLSTVMSNSFAFGGNNASIIFSETPGDVKSPDGKKEIYITGIGAALPTGNGVDKYVELCNSGDVAAEIPSRAAVGLDDYNAVGLKMAFYRKLDRFSQLQAVSGMQALADGGYTVTAENAFDGGIVVGTSEGAVEQACDFEIQIAEHGNSTGSAFKFPNTVYNAAGGYLSICSGLKGYNVTVTNGAQSALYGLGYAMQVIDNGDAKAMVVAGTDTNNDIMDELLAGVGVKADATARVYNFRKDVMALSDGSVSLLIEEGDAMRARGAKPYAKVTGFGTANKPVPFYTVNDSGAALDAAMQNALSDAGVDPREIDAVVGFANGHSVIDTIETESIKRVFNRRHVPMISVKNRVGEGRATTAALAVAHAALMISEKIPMDKAYEPLAFKVSESPVFGKNLKKVLVISFGSGGVYSAVVLEKA